MTIDIVWTIHKILLWPIIIDFPNKLRLSTNIFFRQRLINTHTHEFYEFVFYEQDKKFEPTCITFGDE